MKDIKWEKKSQFNFPPDIKMKDIIILTWDYTKIDRPDNKYSFSSEEWQFAIPAMLIGKYILYKSHYYKPIIKKEYLEDRIQKPSNITTNIVFEAVLHLLVSGHKVVLH
jgi:hypothetical protein